MKKELVKLANHLDRIGLIKEADYVDSLVKRAFAPAGPVVGITVSSLMSLGLSIAASYFILKFLNGMGYTKKAVDKLEELVAKTDIGEEHPSLVKFNFDLLRRILNEDDVFTEDEPEERNEREIVLMAWAPGDVEDDGTRLWYYIQSDDIKLLEKEALSMCFPISSEDWGYQVEWGNYAFVGQPYPPSSPEMHKLIKQKYCKVPGSAMRPNEDVIVRIKNYGTKYVDVSEGELTLFNKHWKGAGEVCGDMLLSLKNPEEYIVKCY